MAELDHRVKNTLANIQALVVQSSRSAESLTIFVEGLDKRIRSMAKAHSLLTQSRWEGVSVDAALLDVNLAGEMSWEVATILKNRNIPFAFSTGYGEADLLPDSLAGSLVVSKPYEVYDVEQCLRQLMGGRAESAQPA